MAPPISARMRAPPSIHVLRLSAAMMPSGMPMKIVTIMAANVNSMVAGR